MGVAFTFGLVGMFILIPVVLIGIAITGIVLFIVGLVLRKLHKKAQKRKVYPIVLVVMGAVLVLLSSVAFFTPSINPLLPILTKTDIIDVLTEPDNSIDTEDYMEADMMGKMQSEAIIEGFKNKDAEAIKKVFCELAENQDIDVKIAQLLEFIDGNIISYDEPQGGYSGSESTPQSGVTEKRISGKIENIKTDTGKTYSIGFEGYYLKKYIPSLEGVVRLYIYDEDTYENGYPEHGRIEVEIGIF